jgi:hypothetical protein
MIKQKLPALYTNIAVKQYKVYDWMKIDPGKDKLISEKHQDPLETLKMKK